MSVAIPNEDNGQVDDVILRWFCKCITVTGEEVFLVARAYTEAEASQHIHNGYAIDYIEDIYTPNEVELQKRFLKPSMVGIQQYQ